MKYRKKPVVVEAFQMTPERRKNMSEWPEWLKEAWEVTIGPDVLDSSNQKLSCTTLEGVMRINWGDFIIRGVHGEIYPCKPDIFNKTYEKVEE